MSLTLNARKKLERIGAFEQLRSEAEDRGASEIPTADSLTNEEPADNAEAVQRRTATTRTSPNTGPDQPSPPLEHAPPDASEPTVDAPVSQELAGEELAGEESDASGAAADEWLTDPDRSDLTDAVDVASEETDWAPLSQPTPCPADPTITEPARPTPAEEATRPAAEPDAPRQESSASQMPSLEPNSSQEQPAQASSDERRSTWPIPRTREPRTFSEEIALNEEPTVSDEAASSGTRPHDFPMSPVPAQAALPPQDVTQSPAANEQPDTEPPDTEQPSPERESRWIDTTSGEDPIPGLVDGETASSPTHVDDLQPESGAELRDAREPELSGPSDTSNDLPEDGGGETVKVNSDDAMDSHASENPHLSHEFGTDQTQDDNDLVDQEPDAAYNPVIPTIDHLLGDVAERFDSVEHRLNDRPESETVDSSDAEIDDQSTAQISEPRVVAGPDESVRSSSLLPESAEAEALPASTELDACDDIKATQAISGDSLDSDSNVENPLRGNSLDVAPAIEPQWELNDTKSASTSNGDLANTCELASDSADSPDLEIGNYPPDPELPDQNLSDASHFAEGSRAPGGARLFSEPAVKREFPEAVALDTYESETDAASVAKGQHLPNFPEEVADSQTAPRPTQEWDTQHDRPNFDHSPLGTRPPTAFEQNLLNAMSCEETERTYRDLLGEIVAKNNFSMPPTLLICSMSAASHAADLLARLALLIAEQEEEVLIVDANLAEQSLTRNFLALSRAGVCDVATGHQTPDSILFPTVNPRINFAPCGDDILGISRDPIEIETDRLARALTAWQQRYHRILIDVGPADSNLLGVLGQLCDAIAVMVPFPQPPQSEFTSLNQRLNQLSAPNLGWILDGFPADLNASL